MSGRSALIDFPLVDAGQLSRLVRRSGHRRFVDLAETVRHLPYGRTAAADTAAVLREGRGTCSSKHRLLAAVAHECGRNDVELMLGLYLMDAGNTPRVGRVLEAAGMPQIPEMHCYLRYQGRRLDYTGLSVGGRSPFDALMAEHAVALEGLASVKRQLHRAAMAQWASERGVALEAAWRVREACIAALSMPG